MRVHVHALKWRLLEGNSELQGVKNSDDFFFLNKYLTFGDMEENVKETMVMEHLPQKDLVSAMLLLM